MGFKNIIRQIKSVFSSEYDLAKPSIDQYGRDESYKEKFFNIVIAFQKEYGLTKKEGFKYAEIILRKRDKKQQKDKSLTKYQALEAILKSDEISGQDADIINTYSPE